MSVISDIGNLIFGLVDIAFQNAIGLMFVCFLGIIFWLWWMRPKAIDKGKEVFDKLYETTSTKLGGGINKKLAICTYPDNIEKLRETPIHQLRYTVHGEVIGVNAIGIENGLDELIKYSKGEVDNLDKILKENKEYVNQDRIWIIFAYKCKTKGFILPKVKKGLIFVKPNQIIDMESSDNIIRIKGIGMRPVGWYEVVVDDMIKINKNQIYLDTIQMINEEVTLGTMSKMADMIEYAIKSDSLFRKTTALEGIGLLNRNKEEMDE